MKTVWRFSISCFLAAAVPAAGVAADNRPWQVTRMSGDVWTTSDNAQPVSLTQQTEFKPGDSIRTGRNGRVLLKRGEETMLVSPNSAVTLPVKTSEGKTTTIVQQAGSILLEVEKRNVEHFEVETPYLAAVVKGTQFQVSVDATGTKVNVVRGQVQVADFRSGQIAQIMPGQAAAASAVGKAGLSLSGTGTFAPIEQGVPRPSGIERLPVPKNGLSAPRNASATSPRGAAGNKSSGPIERTAHTSSKLGQPKSSMRPSSKSTGMRIGSAIGEVRLNVQKVTNGLAREGGSRIANSSRRNADTTVWAGGSSPAAISVSGIGSAGSSSVMSVANTVAAATASGSQNNGNASGNSGNSNSGSANNNSGKGNNGNGQSNGNGNGQGNFGNGNGNGGANGQGNNGNGNGNGNGNKGNGNGLALGVGLGNGVGVGVGLGNGVGVGVGLGNGNGLGLGLGRR